jgi:hypothetical protein
MTHTLIVESIQETDRNIVLLFENRALVGLNFWQGYNDMYLLDEFKTSDIVLFEFMKRHFKKVFWLDVEGFCNVHLSDDYKEILYLIDNAICEYLNIKNKITELETQLKKLKELI